MPGSTKKEDGDHRPAWDRVDAGATPEDRPLNQIHNRPFYCLLYDERGDLRTGFRIAFWIGIAAILGVLVAWFAPQVPAMQPGPVTYSYNITPLHDPFELQVNPGDTLIQGRSYDFTKVLGFNNSFSHWSDYWVQGQDCNPDVVVDVSYIDSNGAVNPKNFRIDPDQMPTGDYFQYDGCFDEGYQKGETSPTYVPYLNGETVIFTVINYSTDYPIITNWENEQATEGFTPGAKA